MRDLTAGMATEFEAANSRPLIIAELEFDSETLRMWNGIGTLTWNGNDYLGGGNLVAVSPMEETQNLEAKGVICTLSGIPTTLLALSLLERTRGRPFRMWLAMVDTAPVAGALLLQTGDFLLLQSGDKLLLQATAAPVTNALIADPYRIFTGMMDVMEVSDDGSTGLIRLSVESSMILGRRAKISRYTAEDQKKLYTSDVGLDFINQLMDKEVVW